MTSPSPLPLAAAIGLIPLGFELFAQALPADLSQYAAFGGQLSMVGALLLALRYMKTREEKTVGELKESNGRMVDYLTKDRDKLEVKLKEVEAKLEAHSQKRDSALETALAALSRLSKTTPE